MRDISDEQWRKVKAYYYALVSHIDDQVGRMLAQLDQCGLTDNTIVMFTADHGEHLGDHGVLGKGQAWDSCSRVPLLVSFPEAFAGGEQKSEIVEAVDLVPTLLDWCGVQTLPYMQGRSFRSLLEGGEYTPRASAFIEMGRPFAPGYKAVRTHEHLYVRRRSGKETLYDLASDPHQLTDVAGDPAHEDGLRQMREEMLRRWFDTESQYPLRTGPY